MQKFLPLGVRAFLVGFVFLQCVADFHQPFCDVTLRFSEFFRNFHLFETVHIIHFVNRPVVRRKRGNFFIDIALLVNFIGKVRAGNIVVIRIFLRGLSEIVLFYIDFLITVGICGLFERRFMVVFTAFEIIILPVHLHEFIELLFGKRNRRQFFAVIKIIQKLPVFIRRPLLFIQFICACFEHRISPL